MKRMIKETIQSCLKSFGVEIVSLSHLQKLTKNEAAGRKARDDIEFLLKLPKEHTSLIVQNFRNSKSQLRQDLFVLQHLNFKRNGYFVEFGATNGIDLSNSYLLEKDFGWNGILAEPAKCWHKDLPNNRQADLELNCVWKDTGSVLTFNEVDGAELSTIDAYSGTDFHSESRKKGNAYEVQTISLNDLLKKYNAPSIVDYLSIDTEGSEFEILNAFDFEKHSFSVITCEHNFTPMREKIHLLLSRNGYVRIFEELSQFDDWYVKSN